MFNDKNSPGNLVNVSHYLKLDEFYRVCDYNRKTEKIKHILNIAAGSETAEFLCDSAVSEGIKNQ